jgi:hypothetical protein
MGIKTYMAFFLFMGVICLVAPIMNTMMHENVHGIICEAFNGTANYGYELDRFYTNCTNYTFETERDAEIFFIMNTMNEIEAYNNMDSRLYLMIIVLLLTTILIFIVRAASLYGMEVMRNEVQQLQQGDGDDRSPRNLSLRRLRHKDNSDE